MSTDGKENCNVENRINGSSAEGSLDDPSMGNSTISSGEASSRDCSNGEGSS